MQNLVVPVMVLIAVLIEIVLPLWILYKIYKNFHAIKYYAKFTFYCFCAPTIAGIFTPYFLLQPKNVVNFLSMAGLFRVVAQIIGVKFTVRGQEHLRKDRTCVIVANHQTSLDIIGMFAVWPIAGKMTAIARMLLMFAGPFGLGSWLCGLIFINKDSPDRGKQKMNEAMEKLKKDKVKLWVFAEGFRNHTNQIVEFKKGAFHMAVKSQVPIVPVVFSSYKNFMLKSEKVFNSGEVVIEAMPEIPTKGLTSSDINSLMEKTRNLMIEKYEQLNLEMENKLKAS